MKLSWKSFEKVSIKKLFASFRKVILKILKVLEGKSQKTFKESVAKLLIKAF